MSAEWCPTQAGTFTGYEPEYFDRDANKWKRVPLTYSNSGQCGLPWPFLLGGILQTLYLFGHEQAQALAWGHAAACAATGLAPDVRVTAYEIVYDVKARKIMDDQMPPQRP